MKDLEDIVYSLNIEDVQTIALQEVGRELSDDEVEKVKKLIGEKINWYEGILNSIEEININGIGEAN